MANDKKPGDERLLLKPGLAVPAEGRRSDALHGREPLGKEPAGLDGKALGAKEVIARIARMAPDDLVAIWNALVVLDGKIFRDANLKEDVYAFADETGELAEGRVFLQLKVDKRGRIVGCRKGRLGAFLNGCDPGYYTSDDGTMLVEATLVSTRDNKQRLFLENLGERKLDADRKGPDVGELPESLRILDGMLVSPF